MAFCLLSVVVLLCKSYLARLFALTNGIQRDDEDYDYWLRFVARNKRTKAPYFPTRPYDFSNSDKDWHNNANCQKLCLEMTNHKPYTKLLMYKHCLHNELVIVKVRKEDGYKVFCVTTLMRGGMYTFINDMATCGNAKKGPILTAPNERLSTYKKIWSQCIDDCSTDCYKDATLASRDTSDQTGTFTLDKDVSHVDKKYGLMCRRNN